MLGANSMLKNFTFLGTLVGLGYLLGTTGILAAGMPTAQIIPSQSPLTQFQRINQPLATKVAVTMGGLGLIGLELWWFLFSKPKSQQVEAREGIQEVTVTVDGGYEPSRIVVQAGQAVRLNFLRRDPSSCLEEVRLPTFHIAQRLTLNKVTSVEFTPTEPGSFEFACGMNMFRGVIEVKASCVSSNLENALAPVSTSATQEYSA
jgi:plastocyanin domain-containing protein